MQRQPEISITDVTSFLISHWKLYVSTLVLFVLVALGVNALFPVYTAAVTLNRNVQMKPADASEITEGLYDSHFDLVAWRAMQEKLIQIAKEQSGHPNATPLVLEIAAPSWWAQHVAPLKALSTDEAKELLGMNAMIVGINKPTEESNAVLYLGRAIQESTRIAGLVVTFSDKTPQTALEKVRLSADFIQNASNLLRLKNYIVVLEQSLLDSENKVALEAGQLNKELLKHKNRQLELTRLHKEYPDVASVLTEGYFRPENVKYLPLANQLIAISLDIYELQGRIGQLSELRHRNELNKNFIAQAKAALLSRPTYSASYESLLDIEKSMRKQIADTDYLAIQSLDAIRYQLITIGYLAQREFSKNNISIIKQPDYFKIINKAAFLGLVVGFLISLCFLLVRATRRTYSESVNRSR